MTTAADSPSPSDAPRAEIGVIGGSGFYTFLDDARTVRVDTPFGAPSDDIVIGTVADRTVAFLARHGQGHRFPPHRVNYRANLWALRSVGVREVLAPCAVGGLDPRFAPGTVVVPDQVVDRTWGREHTIYDAPGPVVHVGFADPYCPTGRHAVLDAAGRQSQLPAVDGGTLVVINGPRFSSRAESQWHQSAGWSVVGMTGMPEASIARELAMCLTSICLVTDSDAGVEGDSGVTHDEVLAVFATKVEHLKELVRSTIAALPAGAPSCECQQALDGITLPFELP